MNVKKLVSVDSKIVLVVGLLKLGLIDEIALTLLQLF
jgi:hypothetical protein